MKYKYINRNINIEILKFKNYILVYVLLIGMCKIEKFDWKKLRKYVYLKYCYIVKWNLYE